MSQDRESQRELPVFAEVALKLMTEVNRSHLNLSQSTTELHVQKSNFPRRLGVLYTIREL